LHKASVRKAAYDLNGGIRPITTQAERFRSTGERQLVRDDVAQVQYVVCLQLDGGRHLVRLIPALGKFVTDTEDL